MTEAVLQNSRNALGMQADVFAQKALKAIHQRQKNVYIGGVKERLAMLMKRLTPGIFDWFIKNQKVT
jgi:short-subunit dehydrogenase